MSETVTCYFFDTSALVKRYHDEVGTAAVDEAFDDEDAFCLISDLTVIECHSAFAKKVRTQEIGEEDYQVTMQRLMQDVDRDLLRLRTLGEHEKRQARSFLRSYGTSHGLRTLDAFRGRLSRRGAHAKSAPGGNASSSGGVPKRTRCCRANEETAMPETRVPVEEMQSQFDEWIRRVEEGERLVLTRGGREIARVHTANEATTAASLPSLEEWRASIDIEGERMSKTVQRQREEERY